MKTTHTIDTEKQTFVLEGALDQNTYPAFDAFVQEKYQKGSDVLLDLTGLSFISSVGLRSFILLAKLVHRDKRRITVKALEGSLARQIITLSGYSKLMPFVD